MEKERRRVKYTLEPHFDAGLFDNTQEEWKLQKEEHEGYLLSWSSETRIGANGQNEVISVGIIEDAITHDTRSIPRNRITLIQ